LTKHSRGVGRVAESAAADDNSHSSCVDAIVYIVKKITHNFLTSNKYRKYKRTNKWLCKISFDEKLKRVRQWLRGRSLGFPISAQRTFKCW